MREYIIEDLKQLFKNYSEEQGNFYREYLVIPEGQDYANIVFEGDVPLEELADYIINIIEGNKRDPITLEPKQS